MTKTVKSSSYGRAIPRNAAHMICGPELHLPVYVRAHTRLSLGSPRKPDWEPRWLPQWAKNVLVIDCQTTVGLDQKLNFGFYRWCKLQPNGHYACQEEGIFHRNDLENDAVMLLCEFAHTHKAARRAGQLNQDTGHEP